MVWRGCVDGVEKLCGCCREAVGGALREDVVGGAL